MTQIFNLSCFIKTNIKSFAKSSKSKKKSDKNFLSLKIFENHYKILENIIAKYKTSNNFESSFINIFSDTRKDTIVNIPNSHICSVHKYTTDRSVSPKLKKKDYSQKYKKYKLKYLQLKYKLK
jgi:hypothetical protein